MKAIDRPFTKITKGTTQFVIPIFQRDYGWTEGVDIQPFVRRAVLGGCKSAWKYDQVLGVIGAQS